MPAYISLISKRIKIFFVFVFFDGISDIKLIRTDTTLDIKIFNSSFD